jgi:hypothetical protein
MLKKILDKLGGSPKDKGVWRQGDVFIVPIKKFPGGLRSRRPILAEGEVTGHAHRLSDPVSAQVYGDSDGLYLQVTADSATVVHEEHGPITVPKGTYQIRIQREYHPKEIRRVVD